MLSLSVMQAAVSSVNFGSFTAPSASRKRRDLARSVNGQVHEDHPRHQFSLLRLDSLAFCPQES